MTVNTKSTSEPLHSLPPWFVTWIERRLNKGVLITHTPKGRRRKPIELPIGAVTSEQFAVITEENQIEVFSWADVVVTQLLCIDSGEVINHSQMQSLLPWVGKELSPEELSCN